ncbi:MAG: asparagine synthase (glutamine-hydrolyzing) [Saprospiraceae bacterium]
MCGIGGIISKTNKEPNLKTMLAAMEHRGPDDHGIWIKEGTHLGHNRLSIIDLSVAGHQPMVSTSGRYIIVYNGEVYNYKLLRKELIAQGISFCSATDTEVILNLWEREGANSVARLRGMFAFAIWDCLAECLTLVRDRLGIKPLYYALTPEGLVFASEIKGMLASGLVQRDVNPKAISALLNTGYVQQPDTIIQEVYALMPGQSLTFDEGRIQKNCYWSLKEKREACDSEEETIVEVRALVTQAVEEEIVADRPVGIFLSGGLDSTVMLAALRLAGHNQVKTFTVGFETKKAGLDERVEAADTARFYGTEHLSIQASRNDLVEGIEDFIEAIDQPSVDGLNTWLVSKFTAPHVTVALSGLGGDELFSGYGIDRRLLYWNQKYAFWSKIVKQGRPALDLLQIEAVSKRIDIWGERATLSGAYSQWGRLFSAKQVEGLTGIRTAIHENDIELFFKSGDPGNAFDELQRISSLHLATFMSSCLLRDSDAVSMAHSMEVRFPILDHRLVETVFSTPLNWKIKKIRDSVQLTQYETDGAYERLGIKHLLFQAFKKDLPAELGERPKRGFKLPIQEWLKTGFESRLEQVLLSDQTYLNPVALRAEWQSWKQGHSNWNRVWLLFILESWIKKYI